MTMTLQIVVGAPASVIQLRQLLQKAKDAYYNSGEFISLTSSDKKFIAQILDASLYHVPSQMTDAMYDKLEDKLRELNPNDPLFKNVGAVVRVGKVKLPYPMASLDQLKTDDQIERWADSQGEDEYIEADKLDGVSIEVTYNGGEIKAYTRGNGSVGQDITHLVPFMDLPAKSPFKALRGEIIMSKSRFDQLYAEEFENARNMVSGLVNAKKLHPAVHKRHIDVIFYAVLDPIGIPSQQLTKLKSAGFKVVPYRVIGYNALTTDKLSKDLEKRRSASKYEIDGLVITANKRNHLTGAANPPWAFKFKTISADATAKTTVVRVQWNPSKHGALKPRIEVKPVRVAGVTVTWATGHNAKYIYDNKIGPGTVITLIRSGDVIPYVQEVLKGTKAQMPDADGYNWKWDATKVNTVLVEPSEDDVVKIKRLTNFFRVLGAENVSIGLVSRAYEAGYDTPTKIMRMTQGQWMKLPGFKEALAERSYQAVQDAISGVDPTVLADATGFLGAGFGQSRFAALLEMYPNALKAWVNKTPAQILGLVSEVPGIGPSLAKQAAAGFPKLLSWLAKNPEIKFAKPEKVKVSSRKLAGQFVTFTGFRDADLAERIMKNGGTYVDFGSKSTILVYGGKQSTKVDKAKARGVKTMPIDQFLTYLKKLGV